MKIYSKEDVELSFSKAIDASSDPDVDAKILGVLFGSLAVSLETRKEQLIRGLAKSRSSKSEIDALNKAAECLVSKMNTGTVSSFSDEILAAHKAYVSFN